MKISNRLTLVLTILLCFIITNLLTAQLIIEQIETDLPISNELIPEDMEFDSEDDMNGYIFSLSESKLRKAALAEGRDIREEKIKV